MGKYLPSKKDLKANQRFRQSLNTQSKFIRPSVKPAAPKAKKK